MPFYYGIYKTINDTWRETGPWSNYEIARQNAEFFADGREFEIITEESMELLKRKEKWETLKKLDLMARKEV